MGLGRHMLVPKRMPRSGSGDGTWPLPIPIGARGSGDGSSNQYTIGAHGLSQKPRTTSPLRKKLRQAKAESAASVPAASPVEAAAVEAAPVAAASPVEAAAVESTPLAEAKAAAQFALDIYRNCLQAVADAEGLKKEAQIAAQYAQKMSDWALGQLRQQIEKFEGAERRLEEATELALAADEQQEAAFQEVKRIEGMEAMFDCKADDI